MAYSGKLTHTCAQLSALVYELPGKIVYELPAIFKNNNYDYKIFPFVSKNSRLLMVSTHNSIFIVFRGTVFKSKTSWVQNLKIVKRRWIKGRVHRGFLGIYKRTAPSICNWLRKHYTDDKQIYITGHSQGGAVAFITAISSEIVPALPKPSNVYTFGQPRAGDNVTCRHTEQYLATDLSRIANKRDVVIGVPFVWNGYDHTCDYYHYNYFNNIHSKKQNPGQSWPFFTASITDHFMKNYLIGSAKNINIVP